MTEFDKEIGDDLIGNMALRLDEFAGRRDV